MSKITHPDFGPCAIPTPDVAQQILYAVDATAFVAVLPVISEEGLWLFDEDDNLVWVG